MTMHIQGVGMQEDFAGKNLVKLKPWVLEPLNQWYLQPDKEWVFQDQVKIAGSSNPRELPSQVIQNSSVVGENEQAGRRTNGCGGYIMHFFISICANKWKRIKN